ncbi:MAG: DUF86 domain-containing protein [Flavobacteriales bacterium]|jgi:uncharacterized protein with HEPN domain|nr:DUF86 domain-containing protein [Flavobacteriales bacterium]
MSEHNDEPLLMDMLDACRAVTTYLKGLQLEDFLNDKLVQDAVAYRLQIIGEAAYKVSPETKANETAIDWFKITGLRHRIVHDYRNIDLETLWRISQKYVPPLAERLERIASDFGWNS